MVKKLVEFVGKVSTRSQSKQSEAVKDEVKSIPVAFGENDRSSLENDLLAFDFDSNDVESMFAQITEVEKELFDRMEPPPLTRQNAMVLGPVRTIRKNTRTMRIPPRVVEELEQPLSMSLSELTLGI